MSIALPIPATSVESRQHIFVPYGTGKANPHRELLIIHTGQLTVTWPATGIAGSMTFADVTSFIPYGDDGSGKIKVQNYANLPAPQVAVTASVGAFQSAPKSGQNFMTTVEQMTVGPPVKQTTLAGDPFALVLHVMIGVERGAIYRIPYHVTVRLTSGSPQDTAQINPGLLDQVEDGTSWFAPGSAPPEG
ncbi:hypothetical protein [Streptomyces sp. NBC_00120]|uniref:hypothetical protein n=1 Tax=Streptomyces sp. NBC_00120 TaxID=2975660 RepID=UPI00225904D7|nr:hypothetical protein [Streptomyces sp. NBC_00120]MCX5326345.1 hypothetical protein [Streptomyces sp. NBC_00120]